MVTPFIALSAVLIGTYGIINNYLVLKKKTKIIGSVLTIAAIISLLNILFVPLLGIIGAAVVTLISSIVAFFISIFYTSKYFKIDFDYKFTLKSIIASILMSVNIILIDPQGIIDLSVVIITSIIIYLSSIVLLKGISKNEINFFKNMINK